MKLTKYISILVLTFAVLSCSKSDDSADSFNYNKDNLAGTFSLTGFKSKKVKTVEVDGFKVTTTTVATGDTFQVLYKFDSNNVVTTDGTYRVTEVKTQSGESTQDAYIIVLDNDKINYQVKEATNELVLDGKTFKVNNFTRTGFKINFEETTVQENGDTTVFEEEWVFNK